MRNFFFILYSLFLLSTFSQSGIKDSLIAFPAVGLHLNAQLPLGDMAQRFGFNYATGGDFSYKTEKNFLFNIDFTFIFGNNIKEKDLVSNLLTKDGFIINKNGNISDATFSERGFYLTAGVGKIFSNRKIAKNKNSGILINANFGYLQHKIRIYDLNRRTAQIENDYLKGYDRLSGGPCVNLFLGYQFYSNSRIVNFKAGFDLTYAKTKSLRKFNYDTFQPDTKSRNDLLLGIKFEWTLPLYKSSGKDFYYY
jgi:hypothetical protein